jgi:hypothetical protein
MAVEAGLLMCGVMPVAQSDVDQDLCWLVLLLPTTPTPSKRLLEISLASVSRLYLEVGLLWAVRGAAAGI